MCFKTVMGNDRQWFFDYLACFTYYIAEFWTGKNIIITNSDDLLLLRDNFKYQNS